MRRQPFGFAAIIVLLASTTLAQAPPPDDGRVPPVVRFAGTLAVAAGRVPVTFGLYAEQAGGEPLWSESQAVSVDESGRYAAVLGSLRALPAALFVSGEARWLEVAVEGRPPQPRVMLVSVPYALKAADADTLGGRPLSAFVLAGDRMGVGADGLAYVDRRVLASGLGSGASGGAGSPNYIGLFSDATTLVNSVMYQSGTSLGVNTTAPLAGLHAVSDVAPTAYFDVYSNALGALPVVYRAARGTPAAPAAVQANDILGGLAVRGYGVTGWSSGRGQVMYKAAENWTDSAQGTYLQLTTTPVGTGAWAERMRITPDGKVGIGTSAPAQALSVAGTIESTSGGFRFPDGTVQASALSTGANTFTGTQTIGSGNLVLPRTWGATSGVLMMGDQPFLHTGNPMADQLNTFVGTQAGTFTSSGEGANVGVGTLVLAALRSGAWNTAVGYMALNADDYGESNTAVGALALSANTSGSGNSALGVRALGLNTSGYSNAAFGNWSLMRNTSGSRNSAFGPDTLSNNTTASDNSAIGWLAMLENTTGTSNTAVGGEALRENTTASGNSALGFRSLWKNTTGLYNAGVGAYSLVNNTTASRNTAVGYRSLATVATGGSNTAVGYSALALNTNEGNSAFGAETLSGNTTGGHNSAFGYQAMANNTYGNDNTAFGYQSLFSNTTHGGSTAFGFWALYSSESYYPNDAFGARALYTNTTGGHNAAFGREALLSNTTGSGNVAVGAGALDSNTTGSSNVGVGGGTGGALSTGSQNTFVGAGAGSTHPDLANGTAIGYGASVTQDDSLVLGNSSVSVGIGTSAPNTKLQVVGNIRVGTSGTNGCVQRFDGTSIAGNCSSDLRLKRDVRAVGPVLARVAQLRPVQYRWRADEFPARHFGDGVNLGLIAQDVERVFPELVGSDDQGYKTVSSSELPYLTIAAVKELKAKSDRLEAENEALRSRLAAIEKRLAALNK
jgi:hypothetical protein